MKTGAMSKLSAAIIVLVMALSAMVALPMASVDAADGTNDINLLVLNKSNGATVKTATVNLINLYTGDVIAAPYSSGMYIASEPQPGVYRVEVTDANFYDEVDAIPEGISFSGLSPYTDIVNLTAFPTKSWEWNVTVEDDSGSPMSGVTVGFYDDVEMDVVSQGTTNNDGWVVLDMFTTSLADDIWLFASMEEYETNVSLAEVTGDALETLTLSPATTVRGFVEDADGYPAPSTVAYLVSDNSSLPWIKRVLKSEASYGTYTLFAYPDEFTLSVDAYGFKSQFTHVSVTDWKTVNFVLDQQTQRTETTLMEFGADYNSFLMTVDTVWNYDDKIPGLPYSDVASLRMQLDMLGNANGTVDSTEADDLVWRFHDYGPEYVSTTNLLTVNDTVYSCSGEFGSYEIGSLVGDIDLETGVSFTYTVSYSSEEDIDVGAPDYFADAYVKYDDPSVDYEFTVALPTPYELVYNSTGPGTDSKVNSTGYTTFTLDPQEYVGGPEHVSLDFEESLMPSASAKVLTDGVDEEHAYAVTNETGVVLSYIVAVDEMVNFSAADSTDPNGNPLVYTWDFGDGTPAEATMNTTIGHTYLSASANRTVNLTVTDMGDLVNWTEIYVMCDSQDPVPVITIKDLEVNETSGMLEINQGQLVWFNATSSTDDAVYVGDDNGTIRFVEFFYGDGNSSGRIYATGDEQNVSYSWADAGEYNLTLNVTDAVGHWKNTTLKVRVNDTDAPVPTFTVMNATWGTSLVENKTLVFDANATTDNLDEIEDLLFSWYFNDDQGEDSWLNGTGLYNVTHVFEAAGSYAVRVNVTDSEGNWEGYTKTVVVVSGPRPSLVVDSVTFDPETFTEGETGYITVNITNRGSAPATGITFEFAIQNADGTEESIGTWTVVLNTTSGLQISSVEVGATAYIKFPYKFSDPGTFTVKVNVTCTDQLAVDEDVNDVTVNEAGWKKIALWGGVLGVLILVPLLLYLRGRWSKRERRGPRREKPEKPEKAEKAEKAEKRAERERAEKPEKPGKDDEDL